MAQQSSSSSRRWIGGVAAAAVLVAAFFVVRSEFHSAVPVHVATVQFEDIRSTVSTNGKVEPVQDFQAPAPLPGVVSKLFVQVGDKVKVGQELVQMDDSGQRNRIAAAEAALVSSQQSLSNMQHGGAQEELLTQGNDLRAAQATQQQANASLTALEALQAKGAASANEVASARQRKQDADTHVAEVQARKAGRYSSSDMATQQAQVAQQRESLIAAQADLSAVDIRAPFAGTVYSVPVSEHDFVQSGEALLNVADLSKLQVRAYFDEPEIGKLSVGQPVKIVWDARPNETWHGHIEIAPTTIITYGTRNVGECVITVDDANGDLLPNTNVTVTVTTLQKNHVLSIPREALHTDGASNYVYRIVNGRLHKTAVQIDVVTLTLVEITGGLNDGDNVALGATTEAELSDGLEVKAEQ